MAHNTLEQQVEIACRHLLSEQNRDFSTPTYGCFDRRYWGWKLVDYPEATFQRNVYPLAWKLSRLEDRQRGEAHILREAVLAGLQYAIQIQHKDGSFDQAFPHEHSFGATAFLLAPLLRGSQIASGSFSREFQLRIENSLHRAAEFLCKYDEKHGHIANHLAGAAFSLFEMASSFDVPKYEQRADEILNLILKNQSPEGWFLEYEGADPGYQTLCLYYLAQIYEKRPVLKLRHSLEQAVNFLAYFIHPDGTFGGEYGARRTSVYYPGGLALLSKEFPLALSITRAMFASISGGTTVTLQDIDMGNLAPLLSNYICAADADIPEQEDLPVLPCDEGNVVVNFPQSGLYLRGTESYYAVVGISNGGVMKVFDKHCKAILWDDSGYLGQVLHGPLVSTQVTLLNRECTLNQNGMAFKSDFFSVLHSIPTPFSFVMLRVLNLSLMRDLWLGNLVKKVLVKLLIDGKHRVSLQLDRTIVFENTKIIIKDRFSKSPRLKLKWLKFGQKFVSIHMASSRYFEGHVDQAALPAPRINVEDFNTNNFLEVETVIGVSHA